MTEIDVKAFDDSSFYDEEPKFVGEQDSFDENDIAPVIGSSYNEKRFDTMFMKSRKTFGNRVKSDETQHSGADKRYWRFMGSPRRGAFFGKRDEKADVDKIYGRLYMSSSGSYFKKRKHLTEAIDGVDKRLGRLF